jgi:hypothetical protein
MEKEKRPAGEEGEPVRAVRGDEGDPEIDPVVGEDAVVAVVVAVELTWDCELAVEGEEAEEFGLAPVPDPMSPGLDLCLAMKGIDEVEVAEGEDGRDELEEDCEEGDAGGVRLA